MKIHIVGLTKFIEEATKAFSSHSIFSTNLISEDHKGFVEALEQAKKGTAVCLIQADLDHSDLTRTRYLEAFAVAFRVHYLQFTQKARPEIKFFVFGTGEQLNSLRGVYNIFCS